MKRALTAATAYFLALFTLGFIFGTIRVTIMVPRFGVLASTIAEVPFMITAGYFICRWAIHNWQVSRASALRWAMAIWFLVMLIAFETLLGALLFGRSTSEQWATLATPAGMIGLSAQIITALLPLFVGRDKQVERP
jgi:hypothetical protein